MSNKQQNSVSDFFQIFINSGLKTLSKSLDKEVCNALAFSISALTHVKDVESLKGNNVIYKVDYVAGKHQSTLVVLIPEELITTISDILTGGNGDKEYKGALSELDVNSVSSLLTTIFSEAEHSFKHYYDQQIVFSTSPQFLLKENPEYAINSEKLFLDFSISTVLKLTESKEFEINIILLANILDSVMDDFGVSKPSGNKSSANTSLNIEKISDIKINITAELGRTRVPIKYALELVKGSVIELDTLNDADIKVFANDVEFARAQVVAVEDNFGLRITKIITPEERLGSI